MLDRTLKSNQRRGAPTAVAPATASLAAGAAAAGAAAGGYAEASAGSMLHAAWSEASDWLEKLEFITRDGGDGDGGGDGDDSEKPGGGGKQISQPALVTAKSVLQEIGEQPLGTTPSGELLPQYLAEFTVRWSNWQSKSPYSTAKLVTEMGTAGGSVIVQASLLE